MTARSARPAVHITAYQMILKYSTRPLGYPILLGLSPRLIVGVGASINMRRSSLGVQSGSHGCTKIAELQHYLAIVRISQ